MRKAKPIPKSANIIHGPKASGKTRYSVEIAKFLGCTSVYDDYPFNTQPVPENALVLTVDPVHGSKSIFDVLHKMGYKMVLPS